MNQRTLTEAEFYAEFKPIAPPVEEMGTDMWEFEQLPEGIDCHYVWTIVDDGDEGNEYVCEGYHIVNRMGYLVTEKAWSDDEFINCCWFDQSDCDDDNDSE